MPIVKCKYCGEDFVRIRKNGQMCDNCKLARGYYHPPKTEGKREDSTSSVYKGRGWNDKCTSEERINAVLRESRIINGIPESYGRIMARIGKWSISETLRR
jgi:hypothetical protein